MPSFVYNQTDLINALKSVIDFIFNTITSLLTAISSIYTYVSSSISTIQTYLNANSNAYVMFTSVYNAIPEVIRAIFILALAMFLGFRLVKSL